MKTLAIVACIAALAGTARAQGYAPPYGNDQTLDPYYGQGVPSPEPIEPQDTYDEDGYDVDYDVYYDTVAAENYDDGYDPNAYQQFESTLDPYGQWVNDPTYGEVWVPSPSVVGADFTPYASCGDWTLTEYGWTWVSCWDWGWAPFHYGRWVDLVGFGWSWIPGTIWGPGWVSWRYGGGYCGWAPLPPRGVTVGPPRGVRSPWRFVLAHQLGQRGANYLPSHIVPAVFAKTTVVTNLRTANGARFNGGPQMRTPIQPIPLHQVAPKAMPHPSVIARTGVPVQQRPWFRNPAARTSIPLRPAQPGANPRTITLGPRTPMVNRPPPLPSRPYNGTLTVVRPQAPVQVYHPPYSAPTYHAPSYQAPSPVYRAPTPSYHYNAPAPSYHYSAPAPSCRYSAPAPSYHYSAPAPSYHAAPSHFGGSSFGGGGAHFGGGGGRHR